MTIQQHASFGSSAAELNATSKLVKAWESKNAKNAAKAGGISLMALSLAACGGSSTTTTATDTTTTTTTTVTTDAAKSLVFSKDVIDVLAGGSGDDTIRGDNATVSGADSVDGGAGDDTVILTGTTTLPEMSNIESITLKSFTSADLDFTTSELAGVVNITLDTFTVAGDDLKLESGQTLTVDDATGAATAIEIKGDTLTAAAVTISDSGDATNSIDLDFNSTKTTSLTLTESGSDAVSYVDVVNTGAKLATVNINSSYKITLDDIAVATTVNAAGSTGVVTATSAVNKVVYTGSSGVDTFTNNITDAAGKQFSISTGAGDDKVVFANLDAADTFLDSKVTVDGGDGDDTFAGDDTLISELGALTAANYAKKGISNFEVIEITTAHANGGVYDMTNFGVNGVTITTDSTVDAVLKGVTSGGTLVTGKSVVALAGATTSTDDFAITLTDLAGSGDSFTIDINNVTGAGAFGLDLAGIETFTVDASGSDQTNVVELDAPNLTKLIVTAGTGDVDIDLSSTANQGLPVTIVDASSSVSTGGMIFIADASNTVQMTITGGSGGDTITGGAVSDTITAGSGADTINALGGTENTVDISSGGNDTVQFADIAGHFTVTGFATGDVIAILPDGGDDGENVIGPQVDKFTVVATGDDADDETIILTANASTTSGLVDGTEKVADFTDMTDVSAYLQEVLTVADDEAFTVILNDGTNSYGYYVGDAGDATLSAGEIVAVFTVEDHILVAADVTQV